MGKKGSKRKTRWRTLSIGAPPGEEDDEEGLRNGFVKNEDNESSAHTFERNGQGGYTPRRTSSRTSGSSGYGGGGNESHKDDSSGSPSKPKIIFNEEEYTRISTPRQDVLFKKGYLLRKKPWAGNASTSATPSTTASQSASHSTADGSETTEDQQLLDRDSGEYRPVMEPGAQLGYGTFYDHASGYYYEYPVMLVGPAPVPEQIGPGVLTAVPCGPVSLRPIEWVNPAFVPKLDGQPYCVMDYQADQDEESGATLKEQESALTPVENANGTCNESGTGSASWAGSVVGETEEQAEEESVAKEKQSEEECAEKTPLENGTNGDSYVDPMIAQQPPMHVSHVVPAVPQPYMYPGHYMFGPPMVNVNGVTIQSSPMMRTMNVTVIAATCAKRRRKKKRMTQRKPALDNAEDEEEGEYSSEYDNGLLSSRVPWTGCPTTSTTTTTTTTNITRPLNPECQEFQLRTAVVESSRTSLNNTVPTSNDITADENSSETNCSSGGTPSETSTMVPGAEVACNGTKERRENGPLTDQLSSLENSQSTAKLATSGLKDDEIERLTTTNYPVDKEKAVGSSIEEASESGAWTETDEAPLCTTDIPTSANDLPSANEKCERSSSMDELNGVDTPTNHSHPDEALTNGNADSEETSKAPQIDDLPYEKLEPKTKPLESREVLANHDSTAGKQLSNTSPKRKYSAKSSKFVREATPGPDLEEIDVKQSREKLELPNSVKGTKETSAIVESSAKAEDQESDNYSSEQCHINEDKVMQDEAIEGSTGDSGFESQPRRIEYPITEAVKEWLRKANSPDLCFKCRVSLDSSDTEDDGELDEKPSKNLHGNPMPALSANGSLDNQTTLSSAADCGEFARIGNNEADQGTAVASRKKRDLKGSKRKSGERANRRAARKTSVERVIISSSDSCSHRENTSTTFNPARNKKQENVVNDVCEFAEKDSVAGMRVAVNSRADNRRTSGRRARRSAANKPVENVGLKMRRVDDRIDEGTNQDTVNVRTFEKGEIIVTEQGKLLTPSNYQPFICQASNITSESECSNERQNSRVEKTTNSEEDTMIQSVGSIEEPDVLECWEAATIEPVVTPKKMLQSRGIYCEGEAAEDDNFELEHANIEHVQKYYRLARESATSLEETTCHSSSSTLPNEETMVESFYDEEIPVSAEETTGANKASLPVEEAFEVYESCYTGKQDFPTIDSKLFREKAFYGQEGPIPCRAVCCNIQ